jgi:hypothetical protein
MDPALVVAALGSIQPTDALKSQYELLELEGGGAIYVFTGFPKHYVCPYCFAKDIVHALQYRRIGPGYFECPGCKTSFLVKQLTGRMSS